MNENDQSPVTVEESQVTADLHEARGWLNTAADAVSRGESAMSIAEYAQTCAQIGAGYVGLAGLEQAREFRAAQAATEAPMIEAYQTTAVLARRHLDVLDDALVRREAQAGEESRPHDGEARRCSNCGHPASDHAKDRSGCLKEIPIVLMGGNEMCPCASSEVSCVDDERAETSR